MAAMIWDSVAGVFKDAPTPQIWDEQMQAWKDSTGLVWNESMQAWEERWNDVKELIIMDKSTHPALTTYNTNYCLLGYHTDGTLRYYGNGYDCDGLCYISDAIPFRGFNTINITVDKCVETYTYSVLTFSALKSKAVTTVTSGTYRRTLYIPNSTGFDIFSHNDWGGNTDEHISTSPKTYSKDISEFQDNYYICLQYSALDCYISKIWLSK